eukprot:1084207-Pyramimonas_sp.AAC.1
MADRKKFGMMTLFLMAATDSESEWWTIGPGPITVEDSWRRSPGTDASFRPLRQLRRASLLALQRPRRALIRPSPRDVSRLLCAARLWRRSL